MLRVFLLCRRRRALLHPVQAHLRLRPELRVVRVPHRVRPHRPQVPRLERVLVVVAAVAPAGVAAAAAPLCRPLGLRVAEAFWWLGIP